jgi:hypothetical protein
VSEFPTKLKVRASEEIVDATLHDDLQLTDLFEAEKTWAPARYQIIQDLLAAHVGAAIWPKSLRWNWASKAAELSNYPFGPFSSIRLFGISQSNEWQGVLMGSSVGHVTKIGSAGQDLVYVQYLESAPWNWAIKETGQRPKFRGCGKQLLEMAVRWSRQLGLKGRTGLHSLAQAEVFYRENCGMTDCGTDSAYSGLRYFEFSEEQAKAFLKEGQR